MVFNFERLRKARKSKGLSAMQAAAILGCHVKTIYQYEAGKGCLKIRDLVKLADAYNQPTTFFFDQPRRMTPR